MVFNNKQRMPSAVAKQEGDLGITLFLREGRKATLNDAGRPRQDGKALRWFIDELSDHDVTNALTAGL